MTMRGQHGKRHLCFHTVLVFAVIFTSALTAAGLSGDQTGKHTFEVRLASHEKVEGWEMIPGPEPSNTPVWISPDVALTNRDVALAYSDRTRENKPCVGVVFTEDGALKMARLTKSHVGEFLAVILDGRVTWVPKIAAEISERAMWTGNFTEEEAESIAMELSDGQTWKNQIAAIEMKHYENTEWQFALDVPIGWNRFPPVSSNSPYEVMRFEQHEDGMNNLIIFRSPHDPKQSLSEWVSQAQKNLSDVGFGHFVAEKTTIGSNAVIMLDFDKTAPTGETWSCRQYLVPDGTLGYVLGFGTNRRPEMIDLFDRMAKSFRVLK